VLFASIDRFSLTLDTHPRPPECQHCHQSCAWVSHGFVYKQRSIAVREPVGKRVLCSNRLGKAGCGRTVQLYLANEIPGRHYGAGALFLFLSALLTCATVNDAYRQVAGDKATRHGWRWLTCLMGRLPVFRSQLSLNTISTTLSSALAHRCRRLKLLLSTVHMMLPKCSACPCAAYHMRTQTSLL